MRVVVLRVIVMWVVVMMMIRIIRMAAVVTSMVSAMITPVMITAMVTALAPVVADLTAVITPVFSLLPRFFVRFRINDPFALVPFLLQTVCALTVYVLAVRALTLSFECHKQSLTLCMLCPKAFCI